LKGFEAQIVFHREVCISLYTIEKNLWKINEKLKKLLIRAVEKQTKYYGH